MATEKVPLLRRLTSAARLSLGVLFMSVCSVPYILVILLLLPWRALRIRMGNIYGKIVGPTLTRITGTRVEIRHRERLSAQKPAIYITNHSSELDPMLGMWLCPMGGCGIAKKSVGNVPFFGWAYRLSGHLLIERADRSQAIASMIGVGETVKKYGLSIWIWPEGTRSRDGRLLPFKKGFVHLALATGLPIVPIVAHNAHHRWPARQLNMSPGRLQIDVLPAIDTSTWSADTVDQHVAQVRQVFLDALGPNQQPLAELSAPPQTAAVGAR